MAKSSTSYACQSCGAVTPKWSGKCESCGGWNTIVEEGVAPPLGSGATRRAKGRKITLEDLKTEDAPPPRRPTGINEFDRVTGGGLVPGSALLVGGDPGIGKSTIILQALGKYAQNGGHAIYISGEEAMAQVRMRAARMDLSNAPLMLGAATNVEDIMATLESGKPPGIVAIDSIQTLWTGALDAAPGTIAQVRTASFDLVRYAKASGAALLLVGHVTKDGQIAGPKAVEHLVDAVLYFEGERGHHFRVLRATKNRFGATDEIGVFEMTGKGLAEVANPSALFLGDRKSAAPGTAVFAGLEGTRPLLCEIQALVSPCAYGSPRRAVVGWDTGRLAMILAVLDARAGVGIGASDVYLNVAGGLKISEPAADLAAAAALVSSFGGEPLPRDTVFFGEISLSGDIRPVAQAEARLKEAAKLGFKNAFVPAGTKAEANGLALTEVTNVAELLGFAPEPTPRRGKVEIMNLPVTVLDCLIVLVIIVSAGYAAWRGFLWETLTVFAWIAAAFGCLYFGPYMIPLTRSLVSEAWLASVIAYAAVFLAVFIPFAFMSHRFSEAVKHSPIGPLDRAAGVAFGVVRGLVIVGLAYLAFTYFVPIREHPRWLTEARLLPVVQSTSEVLLTVVPDHSRDYIDRALPAVVRQAPPQTQPEAEKPRAASYDPMADLIRNNGKTRDVRQKSAAQIPSKTTKSYGVSERQALDKLVETGGSGKP